MTFPSCTLLWDLDGTLVDTQQDLKTAARVVLRHYGYSHVDEKLLHELVGHGALATLKSCFESLGAPMTKRRYEEALEIFLSYYEAHIADTSALFPHLAMFLKKAQRQGIAMGVITNKKEYLAKKLLQTLNLTKFFPVIIGADTLQHAKPHPAPIEEGLRLLNANPKKTVLVGDSPTDIAAARNSGIKVIGVTFGYSQQNMHALKPDFVLDTYKDLPQALGQVLTI